MKNTRNYALLNDCRKERQDAARDYRHAGAVREGQIHCRPSDATLLAVSDRADAGHGALVSGADEYGDTFAGEVFREFHPGVCH